MIAPAPYILQKVGQDASPFRASSAERIKTGKYVNMTDIKHAIVHNPEPADSEDSFVDLIELLFFAYRDFISDPDAILAQSNFGRAHHRVLHFVDRNPGLTVADLLDILKITKQSLARVLKELIDSGLIEQHTGREDRRQRLLYATPAGQALSADLSAPQEARIRAALAALDPVGRATVTTFLHRMINQAERDKALKLVRGETQR